MSTNLTSKVDCKYGAPMGKIGTKADPDYDGRMYLQHIPLDSGGYDRGGAYWGVGGRLYGYTTADGDWEESGFIRAYNREDAKSKVREMYPLCRFFDEKTKENS